MTLVALVMASSQFGPRIIRSFMESKQTQFVLGLFTATYVYSLIISMNLNEQAFRAFESSINDEAFLGYPILGVFIAAILCVFTLIFFIHHVASSIQADNVVENIARSLMQDIRTLQEQGSPQNNEQDEVHNGNQRAPIHPNFVGKDKFNHEYCIRSSASGYVQAVNHDGLIDLAQEVDGVIELHTRAGQYLLEGSPIAVLFSNEIKNTSSQNLNEYVKSMKAESILEIGNKRTPLQDPEYAINQLVEIALRALSPSMDDPNTAINCIDKIACALASFDEGNLPSRALMDGQNMIRLISKDESFDDIFANAFTQIRQSAVLRPAVVCHLLDTYKAMLDASKNQDHLLEPIRTQTEAMKALFSNRKELHCHADLDAINSRLEALNVSPVEY
jgi:uncharacterized membrane protein